jgi:hypothetical protein
MMVRKQDGIDIANAVGQALKAQFRRGVDENPDAAVADPDARPCAFVVRIVGSTHRTFAPDHGYSMRCSTSKNHNFQGIRIHQYT